MTDLSLDNEATRWSRSGRRWSIILATSLVINFSLIVLAFCSYERSGAAPRPDDAGANIAGLTIEVAETATVASEAPAQAAAGEGPPPEVGTVATASAEPVAVANVEPRNLDQVPASGNIDGPEVGDAGTTGNMPAAVTAPSTRSSPQSAVVIINPPTTGGVVHFTVDGTVISLLPAEYHRLDGGRDRHVVFHRGDDREDCQRVISEGVYVFDVGDLGWELTQPTTDVANRLLSTCRAIATKKP